VELVAVDARVQHVERAHRFPAALVAGGETDEALRLHAVEHLHEIVPVVDAIRIDAEFGEHRLAEVQAPRVPRLRNEVLLAVETGRRDLVRLCVLVADLVPHVGEVDEQTLLGEELHAEAGHPLEGVIRGSLQVLRQVVLEGIRLGRVVGDRVAGLRLVRGDERLQLLGGRLVDGARTEGERADRFVTAARREQCTRTGDTGCAGDELTTVHAESEIGLANHWILC